VAASGQAAAGEAQLSKHRMLLYTVAGAVLRAHPERSAAAELSCTYCAVPGRRGLQGRTFQLPYEHAKGAARMARPTYGRNEAMMALYPVFVIPVERTGTKSHTRAVTLAFMTQAL
jgi:hypothetical protein